jgi:membrane associated rhomboid family serine protease
MNSSIKPKWARAIPVIVVSNILVFLLWNTGGSESQFMIDHFLVSWTGLSQGRFWTLITSVFSHNALWHLLLNMYVLSGFGSVVERILGTGRFLKLYLIAGLLSSLCHTLVSNFLLNQPDLPALGASGAISAVILFFSLMYPRQKVLILGLIPIPAFWGAVLFIGLDIWGLIAQTEGGGLPIGHGAHLGGALTGIIYYFLFCRSNRFMSEGRIER